MKYENVCRKLENNGFQVSCFESAKDACEYLKSQLKEEEIGFGGSMTLVEMGLYDLLAESNKVYWHQRIPEGKTDQEMRIAANSAPIYFSSVNGLAETGEIINIDNQCNRVASIFYGHKKVYLIAGSNKLAPTYEEALYRARNIAAPRNAQRLNMKTPCALHGDKCYDCDSEDRICRGLSVLWKKPKVGEFEVILIDEILGY